MMTGYQHATALEKAGPEPDDDTSTSPTSEDENEVDEQSEESFPASDPPAY